MSMDTEASLRQYISQQLKLPLVARVGPLARMFDFVASAAPGVKEIVTVGKLCWEVRERHYDTIVVDAPLPATWSASWPPPRPSTSLSRWSDPAANRVDARHPR